MTTGIPMWAMSKSIFALGHPDFDARGSNDDQSIPAKREVPRVE
jgi:hypothetical protein